MAQPLEDELAAITGSAPQGVRRRADVSYTTEKPDYAKELDASFARVGSYAPAVTGLARQIGVEVGVVNDSPARRNAAAAAERLRQAEEIVHNDAFVQAMVHDFGAKIVPGSIQPL